MTILIYVLIILAIGSIVYALTGPKKYIVHSPSGLEHVDMPKIKIHSLLSKIFPFTQKILERLNLDVRIRMLLETAHVRITAQEFVNIVLIFLAAAWITAYFILGKFDIIITFGASFIIILVAHILIKRKIAQRKEAIVKVLPETVDLLGLCVEAGLDFTTAVRWVIDKLPSNPMIEELSFVSEEIKWGKSRSQALKDMSKRLNIPEISSFVQTLVQAERMGTPVSDAFAILSEDTRMQRFHRGERFALKAPIKILIPLIFCILPVIAIVVGGPILLRFTSTKIF